MVADRVVALASTRIGRRTVMGSGALCKRDTSYGDGETWIGNGATSYMASLGDVDMFSKENGEAICLSSMSTEKLETAEPTTTPFGRAFYLGQADYFVLPSFLIFILCFTSAAASAIFWSIGAISTAQILNVFYYHAEHLDIFRPRWFRVALLYGFVVSVFIVVFALQAISSVLWVIVSKWAIIGRRRPGRCEWDKSDYCQRWQLHLTLTQFMSEGGAAGGVLGPLTGSVYFVWYLRALGAKIGKNCGIFAGGKVGLMTEPDLVEVCVSTKISRPG